VTEYKPYLDQVFEDAEQLMWDLSEATGYFTNHAFLRSAFQRKQAAYIGLLNAALVDNPDKENLFNQVHLHVGRRLSDVAQKAGYQQDKNADVQEVNIWGDDASQTVVVYQRTEQVAKPG
jgi:hypothetical protein